METQHYQKFSPSLILITLVVILIVFSIDEINADADYYLIKNVTGFHEFPEHYDIKGAAIISNIREDYVFPDDPLEYQVTVYNPRDFDREVRYILTIKKGNETETIDNVFLLQAKKERTYPIDFHLKEVGAYSLKLQLIFDVEKTPQELKQIVGEDDPIDRALDEVFIDVQSSMRILQDDLIRSNLIIGIPLVVATGFLVLFTYLSIKRSSKQTSEELKLTRVQLENTFRAELRIERADSGVGEKNGKPYGFFKAILRNIGTVSATNIKVYNYKKFSEIKLEELIKKRKKIKSTGVIEILGSVPREGHTSVQEIPVPMEEKKPFDIAIWIEYDYLEKRKNELIQIFHVSKGTVYKTKTTYEKHHIEEAEKNLKEKGLILDD